MFDKGAPDGGLSNANLFAAFTDAASANPDRAFLITGKDHALFYATMLDEVAKASAWLAQLGAGQGSRVLVQAAKSVPSVILYLACLRSGAVYVPLNGAYQEAEIAYFLGDADPALVVASRESAASRVPFAGQRVILGGDLGAAPWREFTEGEPVAQLSGDAPAAILYTSGTTGKSKGAVLTHANLASNAATLAEHWRWQDDDVLLHALPIFHVHGLFVALHCAMLRGTPIIFHEGFDLDRVLADLPAATVFMGVPTFYTRLLDDPRLDRALCAGMRLFVSGSAPLLVATFEAFRERTGHVILERYGMTEALMVTSNPYLGRRIAGSVGPVLPGIVVRVVRDDGADAATGEPGVLHIKGPNLFAGYWRNPEKTAEDHTDDGYFISGDIATCDAEGVVRIVGRAKDLIITGGYNVYPKEVELVVDAEAGVAESAVIGVPHPDFGEGVVALVVAEPGAELDADVITIALSDKLAAFKRPKAILIVPDLPRNEMGKVQKARLREQHAALFSGLRAPQKNPRSGRAVGS